MKKNKPLVEALEKFVNNGPVSFHVPGHKNGLISGLPQSIRQALTYDVTELNGLDDFHHPEESIAEAEKLLSETYNSDKSFFLVNGSTVGNLAMIYSICSAGDTVIVQRNAHKSIFHAIELVGAHPVFVAPEWDEHTSTIGSVETSTLLKAIELYPYAKAVIFTYPTYYGVTSKQLEEQIVLCHERHIPVLIDEAHGAHLIASKKFPKSALELGADIVVQSAHKTLPAMTMASFLHVKSNLIQADKINEYLRMLQSSSPSYLLMASLDDARHYVANYLESDYYLFSEKRMNFIDALRRIPTLRIIEADDPLKLLLRVDYYSGYEVKEALENVGIYVELADTEQVLLVLPLIKQGIVYPFTSITVKIKDAVRKLQVKPKTKIKQINVQLEMEKVTTLEIPIKEIQAAQKEWISYTKAIGRIAAETIIPYPPGIPLFLKGEKITVAKLAYLAELQSFGADFQGNHQLSENRICVIK